MYILVKLKFMSSVLFSASNNSIMSVISSKFRNIMSVPPILLSQLLVIFLPYNQSVVPKSLFLASLALEIANIVV